MTVNKTEEIILEMLKDIGADWQMGERGEIVYEAIGKINKLPTPKCKECKVHKEIIGNIINEIVSQRKEISKLKGELLTSLNNI